MGIDIHSSDFSDADRRLFSRRLEEQLERLSQLLSNPDFGRGPSTMGAELELYLIDAAGHPIHENARLHTLANDPQLTLELNQYNLEYNLTPQTLSASGLLATEEEIGVKLQGLAALAAPLGVRVVPIGILPTLRKQDFGDHCITDKQRYRALVKQLIASRGSDFEIDINGANPLQLSMANITLEGANTSFQVHQRVEPEDYAASFNAIQLVTPLALAISANSPGLFGHQLWDETRVPLFKQSIDTRDTDRYAWSEPARVSFGHGWVRRGPRELFEQAVRLYSPLLPACETGQRSSPHRDVPELAELRLHQSTVWLWNRPVYDHAGGGHLRIEMRALPAGPSAIDMVAGAALTMGLARGLRDQLESHLNALPFPLAEYNFYRSAQHGLNARLVWPDARQQGLRERAVGDILNELLPTADDGLRSLGVSQHERDRYLGVIERRLAVGRNGAAWQRECTQRLVSQGMQKTDALAAMLERYREHSSNNLPVAEWPF